MLDRMGRDKMHYRIAHINIPIMENKEEVLRDMYNISNPNFQDYQGVSYLHMACQAHSLEAIKILLELGADPNLNDNYNSSPITWALGRINPYNNEILELMLKFGLDLYKKEGEKTLIEWIEMFKDEGYNNIISDYLNDTSDSKLE